jgi:hypothetical protein
VVGTGLATIFRYFSYKKWVFLAGAPGTVVAAGEAAVSGIVDSAETSPVGVALTGAGDGPPWEELEPPGYSPAWEHLEPADSDGGRR